MPTWVPRYLAPTIRAVVFDVGECLVDETREYGAWADWLGVPRHTFHAMFGVVIAQGRDYRETFQESRPGFDLYEEREKRAAAEQPETFGEGDLYEDVRPALTQLRADGLWLGIAGNQTVRAGRTLRSLFSDDVDLIGTSGDWGASKPDPEFYQARGCCGALRQRRDPLRRGPVRQRHPPRCWGRDAHRAHPPWSLARIQWNNSEARELPTFRVGSLLELCGLVLNFNGSAR